MAIAQVSLGEAFATLMKRLHTQGRSGGNQPKRDGFDVFRDRLEALRPELLPLNEKILDCYEHLRNSENRLDTVDPLIVAHYACDPQNEVVLVSGDNGIIQNQYLSESVKEYWEAKGIKNKNVFFREPCAP